MHTSQLLAGCTTQKWNKYTHTTGNGCGKHTGDLEMFRAGQGKPAGSQVVWGSGATVSSVGAVLSQEGAVRLYEIVTPRKNTLQGNSNRALKPWEGQETRGPECSDKQLPQQASMGGHGPSGVSRTNPAGQATNTANCSSASQIRHYVNAIS